MPASISQFGQSLSFRIDGSRRDAAIDQHRLRRLASHARKLEARQQLQEAQRVRGHLERLSQARSPVDLPTFL